MNPTTHCYCHSIQFDNDLLARIPQSEASELMDRFFALWPKNARVRMVNNCVAHAVIIIIFNVSQFVINWIHIFPLQIGDSY